MDDFNMDMLTEKWKPFITTDFNTDISIVLAVLKRFEPP